MLSNRHVHVFRMACSVGYIFSVKLILIQYIPHAQPIVWTSCAEELFHVDPSGDSLPDIFVGNSRESLASTLLGQFIAGLMRQK